MAEYRLLHQKIGTIHPFGPRYAFRSDLVYIAILWPYKGTLESIQAADVLWVKCPAHKTVASLLKVLRRDEDDPVSLFQGTTQIGESRLVSSLLVVNQLCVMEALDNVDATSRHQQAQMTTPKPPMQDITNRANNQMLVPRSTDSQSEPFVNGINTIVTNSAQSKPQKPPTTTEPLSTPLAVNSISNNPSVRSGTGFGYALINLAWIDFSFERRECNSRPGYGQPQLSLSAVDEKIKKEWVDLHPEQRQYFVDRIQQCRFPTAEQHRAFWIYYFDRYIQVALDGNPFTTFESANQFFLDIYKDWEALESRSYVVYYNSVTSQRCALQVPPLPASSSLPPVRSRDHTTLQPSGQTSGARISSTSCSPPSTHPTQVQPVSRNGRPAMAALNTLGETLQTHCPIITKLNINELFEGRSIDELELGVSKGAEILSNIKKTLQANLSEDSEQWLTAITNIEKQVVKTKTIVGVVGATGAGKSSVINAMLDQERLVPTNCMRACTAVVTEISYNYEEVPYRADIEFIGVEDWLKELKTSFEDLFDSSGKVAKECTNEESEAGIAYAKIRAVYPLMTKENMENTTIQSLINHTNVVSLLGKRKSIEQEDASVFYKQLQQYVDSKEKAFSRDKKPEAEKSKARQMEYWPLIRVVRLYVKAPALATGAVIVDLPGVHDSNQARAAVAQGYLKQCTGLWIVAPITRAVDDKSAKTLLGDTFKRQLKMDGGYNSVTFICSKTDDISLTEAQDSLGLDEEVAPLYARSEELKSKAKSLRTKLEEAKIAKSDVSDVMEAADEQLDLWEQLNCDLEEGRTVYAPCKQSESKKRKRTGENENPRKKTKRSEDDGDENDIASMDGNSGFVDEITTSDDDVASDHDMGEPLTETIINEKIQMLKTMRKEGRREKSSLEISIKKIRAQITEIDNEQDEIDNELLGRCIRGRNEYSRGAIQQDFASGIRELDHEIAEEEDAANFNPEVDVRDYEAVAKSLPVFCVSSRGYQKLMGRLTKDKGASSFRLVEETGIPALQAHCTKLTVINREASCKRFLNNLSQLLNSLRLWSSSDGTSANLTDEQQKREAQLLELKLTKLDTALENVVAKIGNNIQNDIQDQLYDKYSLAISAGQNEANNTQAKWGAAVNREARWQGGLYWSTYKATVRRDGVWSQNDFNADLIRPTLQHITPGWEKVFSRCLPQTLSGFANEIYRTLTAFHDEAEKRAIKNGTSVAAFQMLKQQLLTYKEIAKDTGNIARDFMNAQQRDINRSFVPIITQAMSPVYAITAAEAGPGQYKRMKFAMQEHVEFAKHSMFRDALYHVQQLLTKMLKDAEDMILTKLDEVFVAIKRDYESVIVGNARNATQGRSLPMQQRRTRREVLEAVDSVDLVMKRVVGLESSEDTSRKSEFDGQTALAAGKDHSTKVLKVEDDDNQQHLPDQITSEHDSEASSKRSGQTD